MGGSFVGLLRTFVERDRPPTCKALMGRASDVASNAHSDLSVTAHIDKFQLVRNRDLGILADMEFVLGQRRTRSDFPEYGGADR
jgi:hypothetical protein